MVERYSPSHENWGRVPMEPDATGCYVHHSEYAALERQIAELRAERDSWKSQCLKAEFDHGELARLTDHYKARAITTEAEIARLRALPLKDEVERDGISRIAAERRRQVEKEGWTPEHDATHANGELAIAAACYALNAADNSDFHAGIDFWPWSDEWWKPSGDPIRDLEKAGALIAAEIDRLMRPVDRAGIDCLKSLPAHASKSLTIKEVERILEPFARHGDTTADYVEIKSDDLRVARALLSRLRTEVQEGWRAECLETIERELIDGLEVEITIGEQEYTFNHRQLARRILSALYPASPSVSEGGSRAALSEQKGERG